VEQADPLAEAQVAQAQIVVQVVELLELLEHNRVVQVVRVEAESLQEALEQAQQDAY
jgi:hypothetical protein